MSEWFHVGQKGRGRYVEDDRLLAIDPNEKVAIN